MQKSVDLDIQGHRGARGLYPENTVGGFIEAVKFGASTLELDVIISKDEQVVVSHEPWPDPLYCFKKDGTEIEENSKEKYNFFRLNYDETLNFDCGIHGHPSFPLQKRVNEHKPLLSEVIFSVEAFVSENALKPVTYNIEIKSDALTDDLFHPPPSRFVDLVLNQTRKMRITGRVIIQSFDRRILQELRQKDPAVPTGLLVEDTISFDDHVNALGFMPTYYNPEFILVTEELVRKIHDKNIKIVPWTVNEVSDMEKLMALGVDGLITDYPDRAADIVKEFLIKR
jgi:glycerophosphoryl diester phosphodiesterase